MYHVCQVNEFCLGGLTERNFSACQTRQLQDLLAVNLVTSEHTNSLTLLSRYTQYKLLQLTENKQ